MYILLLSSLFFFNLSLPIFSHPLIKTDTLIPIHEAIKNADEDTLVVFDVDDVLIYATDQLLQLHNKQELDKVIAEVSKILSPKELENLIGIVTSEHNTELITTEIFDLLKTLKKGKIKYISLTATQPGPLGQIPNTEEWRINHLKSLGFDFENSFPEIKSITFPQLHPKRDLLRAPVFKKGILFSGNIPKGKVLDAFLNETRLKFKKIIFIDDVVRNHDSVANACQKQGIEFMGFHYTAVYNKHAQQPFNKKRADLQIKILLKEQKWLSDIEADKRL